MRASTSIAVALAIFGAPFGATSAAPAPISVDAAVAAPGRSPDNVKLDAARKPAQVLAGQVSHIDSMRDPFTEPRSSPTWA